MKVITLICTVCVMLYTCKVADDTAIEKTIYVAAHTVPCQAGMIATDCMQFKWKKNQKEWGNFYDNIEGFTYEKGHAYELLVKESKVDNPPADASSIQYTLVKIISKNKEETMNNRLQAQPFTTTHVFKAQYQGSAFRKCLGRTALCPKECGNSGNLASFKVLEYIEYIPNGEGGREKLETYQTLTSDYYERDLNKPYVKDIKALKEGDIVTMHIDFVYDTTLSTVATVEHIRRIAKSL